MIATNFEAARSAFRIQIPDRPGVAQRRELRSGVGRALDQGGRSIVVDCSAWSELDLIVLSVLIDCAKLCDERGVDFELENLEPALRSKIGALRLGERLGLGA